MEQNDPNATGVYHRSIRSGSWFLLNIAGTKVLGFATFFVLARLLNPRDYGVIGVALLILGLLDQVTNPSIGDALTRAKGSIDSYLDPYWTFEILRASIIATVLFFSAGAIGSFFHFQGQESTLLRWSGFLLVIQALGNVRQIYLSRDMQFQKIFLRDMGVQISFAIAAVLYAFFVHASVWALFVGYLVSYATSVVLTYILYRSRPTFSFRFGPLKDHIGYSKWVYGQSLLDTALAQSDSIIIGRLLDPGSLGLYARGKNLASTATSIISTVISKVGFVAFAKVQDRMDKVRQGFLKSIDVLLLGGLPLTLLLLLEGGSIVLLLLGPKWIGLIIPLKIFAFGNLFLAFVRIVNPVLAALGRPDVNFKTSLIQTVLSIPLMYGGFTLYGTNGLAGAVVLTWIFLLGYIILRARPVLNIAVRDFVPAIASGSLAGLGVLAVDVAGRSFVHAHESPPLILVWLGTLGLVYLLCLYLVSRRFSHGPWETFVSICGSLLAKKQ